MDDKLKIKLGAIFLAVGVPILIISQIPGFYVPESIALILLILIFLTPVGYGFLMSGLSYRNKGIMLIINGIIFMIPMWVQVLS